MSVGKGKKTHLPPKKQKQNLYEKLLRDGFESDLIGQVLSQATFVDESEATLAKEISRLQVKYRNADKKSVAMKIVANLIGKGYEYSNIIKMLKETDQENK